MKKIIKDDLIKWNACEKGFDFWVENCEGKEPVEQVEVVLKENVDWANWLIIRALDDENKALYAINAAESVAFIYNSVYPDDNTINDVINVIKNKNSSVEELEGYYVAVEKAASNAELESIDAARASWSVSAAVLSEVADSAEAKTEWAESTLSWAVDAAKSAEVMLRYVNFGLELLRKQGDD